MPFQKGNKFGGANGSGRPRMKPSERRALRGLVSPAIERLRKVLENDEAPAAAAIAAAREVLDRNYGKSVQSLEVNDGRGTATAELGDEALTSIASRGSEGTAGTPKRPPTIQ